MEMYLEELPRSFDGKTFTDVALYVKELFNIETFLLLVFLKNLF